MNNTQFKIRRLIHLFTGSLDKILGNKPKAFILNYHGVNDSGWRYDVPKDKILDGIDLLLKKYKYVNLSEINNHVGNKVFKSKPVFSVTFDDGYKDVMTIVDDLDKRGIKPAVFVLSQTEIADRNQLDNDKNFLSFDDINTLLNRGWIVGSHGATHRDFLSLDSEMDLNFEIINSKQKISEIIGSEIKFFAYPKGAYNANVVSKIKEANYEAAYTVEPGYVNNARNKQLIPRIGVDNSHSIEELSNMITPTSILVRRLLKRFI